MTRRMKIARAIAARVAASLTGFVLLVYGLVAAFSPLPAGAPLVVLGALMIAAANPAARPFIRRLRRRWRWFDALVRTVAAKGPAQIKSVESETSPRGGKPRLR
jgi:hypothetical protein